MNPLNDTIPPKERKQRDDDGMRRGPLGKRSRTKELQGNGAGGRKMRPGGTGHERVP